MNDRVEPAPCAVSKEAMLVYAREGSQFSWNVPSQLSGQSPWIVQLSEGPVDGFVSQNCVCSKSPPGLSVQQVLIEPEVWQDVAPLVEHPEEMLVPLLKKPVYSVGDCRADAAVRENQVLSTTMQTASILWYPSAHVGGMSTSRLNIMRSAARSAVPDVASTGIEHNRESRCQR